MDTNLFECANSVENFKHPNQSDLLKESNDKWLTHRLHEKEWTEQVVDHMKQLLPDRWMMVSLFCLSHQPILIPDDTLHGFRIACHLPDGCYLWPLSHMPSDILRASHDKEKCGYHEETIVCYFLSGLQEDDHKQLLNDIEFLYDTCMHRGYIPSTLDYLYKRVCMGTRIPVIISKYMCLPIHPEIRKSICHFGMFLLSRSRFDAVKVNEFIENFLSVTIIVSDEKEWKTIVECRAACGLSAWDKKKLNSVIPVRYGNSEWTSRWQTVEIAYEKKAYKERCDERIQWVSVWLRLVMANKINLQESPAHLICLLCLLHS